MTNKKWIYYTSPAGRNKIQDELISNAEEEPMTSLAELVGFSDDDPEVVAARADAVAYASLIEGLVEFRHERGMTQTDVAEAMGTTQSVISHFERLGGDARFSTVQRYARAVGARLNWQLSLDDTATPRSERVLTLSGPPGRDGPEGRC